MDRNLLMARVRNLLNKTVANGATEAEASVALRAAERLMGEHDLAMAEVLECGGTVEFGTEMAIEFGAREPCFLPGIIRIAEAVFGVEVFCRTIRYRETNRKAAVRVEVFGESSKLEPAVWGVNFLASTFKRLWSEYRVRNRVPSAFAAGYYCGVTDGFMARLDEAKDARPNALVKLDAAMEQAFGEAFPAMRRSIVKVKANTAAYQQGREDGVRINLARPLEQASRRALTAEA